MELLLDSIQSNATIDGKLGILLERLFGKSPNNLKLALYYCSVPHWFNLELIRILDLDDQGLSAEEIYTSISQISFVEEYPGLGYALNSSIRDALLGLMWNQNKNQFITYSKSIAKYFQQLIKQETLHLQSIKEADSIKYKEAKYIERLIFEYHQELTYHLLIADETEGIKNLNELLAVHLLEGRSSYFQSLLRTVSEHVRAGRLSESAIMWIYYWEAQQSKDLSKLEEIGIKLSNVSEQNKVQAKALEGCIYYTLSNLSSRIGNSQKAWSYFYKSREPLLNSNNDLIRGCLLCEARDPINLEHPTPSDWLWLGLNLPNEPSKELFGRSHELKQMNHWLQGISEPPISIIYGLGGMGKTALAHATAKNALENGIVENVLWTSAKKETFVFDRIECMPDRSDFSSFLASTMKRFQLLEPGIVGQSFDEEIRKLSDFLNKHRILLVIDNVETLADAHYLAEYLPKILGKSRAIITGRYKIDVHDAWALKLHGLDESDCLDLLEWNANNLKISSPGTPYWRFIHKMTAGSPLVMKLVVSQLANNSSERVLHWLLEGRGEIYKYVYSEVLSFLSSIAKKLLRLISTSSVPIRRSNIEEQVDIAKPQFNAALAELEKTALIETSTVLEQEDAVYMTDTLTSTHLQHTNTP